MTIKNGANTKLNAQSGTLPDVSGAMQNWFQKITFIVMTQTVVNFRAVKTEVEKTFQGVIQPFTDQQLQNRPQGERAWKWYTVHAETGLELTPGENIKYLGVNYRVMSKGDYDIYGYVKYDLVRDYQA